MDFFLFILFCKNALTSVVPESLANEYAWLLITHTFGKTKTELILNPPHITKSVYDEISNLIFDITIHHKPIQYILKTAPFLDLMLELEPPVLICRSETEALIFEVIMMLKQYHDKPLCFLDIGTGSGCIALSLAKSFPRSTVYAVDISTNALDLARKNAKKNNIDNVVFIKSDLFLSIDTMIFFDLIISNPPYISPSEWQLLDPSVKQWEDQQALIADDNGLFILASIIRQAKNHLNKKSTLASHKIPQLILEIGHNQGESVKKMMQKHSFSNIIIWHDQYGKDRAVWGTL